MANPLAELDRYLIITSDTHAGSDPEGYGPYLERKWQSDYQEWLEVGSGASQENQGAVS